MSTRVLVVEDDQASTTTDSGLSGTLAGSDVDTGDVLTYGISGGIDGGTVSINGVTNGVNTGGTINATSVNRTGGSVIINGELQLACLVAAAQLELPPANGLGGSQIGFGQGYDHLVRLPFQQFVQRKLGLGHGCFGLANL